MYKVLIYIALIVCQGMAYAQTGKEDIFQDVPVYTDLKIAAKNPLAIKRLHLAKTNLSKVPEEIFLFKNLEELDLSKNKIKKVPPEIGELKKLVVLNLSKNKIEELPDEIGNLHRLVKLDVSRNDLFKLPDSIGNCESLEVLHVWDTNLSDLPDSLREIKSLKEIDMRVIVFSMAQIQYINERFPGITIYFSGDCHCGPY